MVGIDGGRCGGEGRGSCLVTCSTWTDMPVTHSWTGRGRNLVYDSLRGQRNVCVFGGGGRGRAFTAQCLLGLTGGPYSCVSAERRLSLGSDIDAALAADVAAYPPGNGQWSGQAAAGGGEGQGWAAADFRRWGGGTGAASAMNGGLSQGRPAHDSTVHVSGGQAVGADQTAGHHWWAGDHLGPPQQGRSVPAAPDSGPYVSARPVAPQTRVGAGRPQVGHTAPAAATGLAGEPSTDGEGRRDRRGRGRRRHRDDDSEEDSEDGSERRKRRRRRKLSSSSSSSSDEEERRDVRAEHRRVPTRSKARPAPAALRLPPLRAQAARRLRRRKRFVAVQETADTTDVVASNTVAYIGRIAAMLVHAVYYFPGLGLQALIYLAWLLDRTGGRPLDVVRRADARARQAMALSPRELLTAPDLDHFLPATGGSSSAARPAPNVSRQVCWRFRRGECRYPCPEGRLHGPLPGVAGRDPRGAAPFPTPGFPRRQRPM